MRNQKSGFAAAVSVVFLGVVLLLTILCRRLLPESRRDERPADIDWTGCCNITRLSPAQRTCSWLFGIAIATLWFMPFVWMVSTSFKYPGDIMTVDIEWLPRRVTLDNYRHVFERYPVLRWTTQ